MDFAELGFKVDSRQLKTASGDLDRVARSGLKAEASTKKVTRATDTLMATYRTATKLATGFVGAMASSAVLRAASDYTTISNSLRALGLSASETTSRIGDIGEIANRVRAPLDATAKLYQRISIAGKDLNATQGQVLKFTENVGLALAQTGGSASEASGALLQLSQAMSGGIVRAEEFNSILEGAFPIAQAAANGIDGAAGSVGRLRQMIIAGDITSREFFDAILSQTSELEAAFANTVPTIGQALTVLRNNFVLLSGSIDGTLNATGLLAQGIIAISENLGRIVSYAAAAATAFGVKYAGAMVIAAARTATLSGALTFLRGAIVRTGIGALVLGAGELLFKFSKLVKASGGFGSALGLLKDVALEVWSRIGEGVEFVRLSIVSAAAGAAAFFIAQIAKMAGAWVEFTWAIADGMNALFGTNVTGASAVITQELEMTRRAWAGVSDGAAEAATAAAAAFSAPLTSLESLQKTVSDTSAEIDGAAASTGDLGGALGGAGGAAGKAADALEDAATEAEAFQKAMEDAALTAEDMGKGKAEALIGGIDGISNAFGDFISRGLTDFKSFVSSILGSFQQMISQMIALAAKNRIMMSIDMSATGGGASAPGGGFFSKILGGGASKFLGTWGGGAAGATASGFLGGISTALGGFSSGIGAGISGMFSTAGTALTTGLGSLSMTLGALVPVAGIAALAITALVGKTKLLDSGLKVTVNDMDALVESFSTVQKSRLFGLIKSTNTSASAAAAEIADPVTQAIGDIQTGVLNAADALGVASDAFTGFSTVVEISTKGMSEDEALQAVLDGLGEVADDMAAMVPGLEDVALAGEGASDTLTRLATDLGTANAALKHLTQGAFDLGVEGAAAASQIVQALGGTDGFNTVMGTYLAGFYSEAERSAILIADLEDAFADLGLAMPQTRDQFRDLVEGMDLTTEYGRALYAQVLSLASAMDQALPSVEYMTNAMMGLVTSINSDISGMITTAQNASRESETAARLWYDTAKTLREFLADLTGSDLGGKSAAAQLEANALRYADTLAAGLGGDNDAAKSFVSVAKSYLDSVQATAGSRFEYERAAALVGRDTRQLAGASTLEGGVNDVLIGLYEQQIDVLTSLGNFLSYEGLTDEQIAELDGTIQEFVTNWDSTLADFDATLMALDQSIKDVQATTYAALQERITAQLDVLVSSEMDEVTKQAILNANAGIKTTIDFVVRQDLPPDLLWLAVNASSEHLKTIDFILGQDSLTDDQMQIATDDFAAYLASVQIELGSNGLTDAEMQIAVDGFADYLATVNITLGVNALSADEMQIAVDQFHGYLATATIEGDNLLSDDEMALALDSFRANLTTIEFRALNGLTPDEVNLALATTGQINRSINLLIAGEADPDALRIALAGTSELSRVVNVTLKSGVSSDLLQLALTDLHDYAVAVQAALSTTTDDEIRRLVYTDAGTFAIIVEAALDLSEDEARVLLGHGSVYAVNVTATLVTSSMDNATKALLLEANTSAIVNVAVALLYPDEYTADELALMKGDATEVLRTVSVLVNTSNLSPEELLFFYELGDKTDILIRSIEATMTEDMTATQLGILDQMLAGDGTVTRTINAAIWTQTFTSATQVYLDLYGEGLSYEIYNRQINTSIVMAGLTSDGELFVAVYEDGQAYEQYSRQISGSLITVATNSDGLTWLAIWEDGAAFDSYARQLTGTFTAGLVGATPEFLAIWGDGAALAEVARQIDATFDTTSIGPNTEAWLFVYDDGSKYAQVVRGTVLAVGLKGGVPGESVQTWYAIWDDGSPYEGVERGIVGTISLTSISGLEGDWIDIWEGSPSASKKIDATVNAQSISTLEQDWMGVLTDYSASTKRTINALLDLETLSTEEKGFLTAISGTSGTTIKLSGGVQLDVSKSFQTWYENTTEDLIADPMSELSKSLDGLRAEVSGLSTDLELQSLQMQLAAAETTQRNAEVAASEALVGDIKALEASTGVDLILGSGDAKLDVNDKGKISYAADAYRYDSSSDVAGFKDAFKGADGLEQQIQARNDSVYALNNTSNKLRNQIKAMGGIPAYATGTDFHPGGLAYVHQDELIDLPRGSRVHTAQETRSMMGGGDNRELINLLREFKEEQRQLGLQVESNTHKMRKLAEKSDRIGQPVRNPDDGTALTVI